MRKILLGMISLLILAGMLISCGGPVVDTSATQSTQATTAKDQPDEPYEEYFLPKEDGMNQLTLYWYKSGADIKTCDVWIWFEDADGRGYPFYRCEYGFKCMVNVPESVSEVGFIVRTNCSDPCGTSWGNATKDFADDRFAIIEGKETFIYLKSGNKDQFHSDDGGKTLTTIRSFTIAGITGEKTIRYVVNPATRITSIDQIKVTSEGKTMEIESLSSLNNNVTMGTITMKEPLDISKQYEVEIEGYGKINAVPTTYFDTEDFINNYTYDGDDLGAVIKGDTTTFKVWAPTASKVVLNLFEEGTGPLKESVDMTKGEKGVWSYSTKEYGHGTYYTYSVTTSVGTQEAVDPYAKTAGVNGNRGMVVDLSLTNPEKWDTDTFYTGIKKYSDVITWEVHVKDFSNKMTGSQYKGKYLAFTETGIKNSSGVAVGIDYLKALGITHVQLQPVYDFATVDESKDDEFNWGYDPKNYNVPEGSYSTDPYHGEVRVNEFKKMIQGIHSNGMGVIMDVVYNHTNDSNSNLNKIVPYYYYRYNASGANSNGSGCGNETASERKMFQKYMIDSVTYWAKEYHIDGFRFDLMALHDIDTMQLIEQALHAINPLCVIYGEGWTGGTSALNSARQATQANISKIVPTEGAAGGIAVFNDAIRDGLKGSVFDDKEQGYISGNVTTGNANKIAFGITGGKTNAVAWRVDNNMVVNYMSCHDNLTLWDKLMISCPDATDFDRLLMNGFGAQIIMISNGAVFFLAGEEMCRSKDGDSNSYKSSDEVNNIRWDDLTTDSNVFKMYMLYSALIAIRKDYTFLRDSDVTFKVNTDASIEVTYSQGGTAVGFAVINPTGKIKTVSAPFAEYEVLMGADDAPTSGPLQCDSGEVTLITIPTIK